MDHSPLFALNVLPPHGGARKLRAWRLSAAVDRLQRLPLKKDGVWDAIWDKLRMELRDDMEREVGLTAAIIDCQSMKSEETYGPPRLQDFSFI